MAKPTQTRHTPLLKTKLYIPGIRPELVPRPRLLEQLNAGMQRKLTLVAAPAGFGKTTLLSAWITEHQIAAQTAWLSLDARDNALATFWTYLIAALQTVRTDIGNTALIALHAPEPPSWTLVLAGRTDPPLPLTRLRDLGLPLIAVQRLEA